MTLYSQSPYFVHVECSSCGEESLDVTYLECKHVVCPACLKTSNPISSDEQTTPEMITSPNNTISLRGVQCPLCCKADRKMTPVISLQLQCLHVLEKVRNKQVKSGTTRSQVHENHDSVLSRP